MYLSIITLNVNGLYDPIKRQGRDKTILYTCFLQETHFTLKDTQRLKGKGWEEILHTNGKEKGS